MRPLALMFPPVHSLEDARDLVRRCWGSWYLLSLLTLLTLLTLIGLVVIAVTEIGASAESVAWGQLAFLIFSTGMTGLLCWRLFARASIWAGRLLLLIAGLYVLIGARLALVLGPGLGALLWIWPGISLLAMLSLINAIRGCRGVRHFHRPDVVAAPFVNDPPSASS